MRVENICNQFTKMLTRAVSSLKNNKKINFLAGNSQNRCIIVQQVLD
jgi:hypothetical protein